MSTTTTVIKSDLQADLEIVQLPQRVIYTLIACIINGMFNTGIIIWFPLIFSTYNIGGNLSPITMLIMAIAIRQVYVCWTVWCNHADVPSTGMLLQEMMFVMQRAPLDRTWHTLTLRAKSICICISLIIVNWLGTAIGILIISQRQGTIEDTLIGKSNIGQAKFDNPLMTYNTTLFFVAAISFFTDLININCYMGAATEGRIWAKWDHTDALLQSPYKADTQAILAMVTVPLMGGLVNYEYIFGTAIVSGTIGDTGIFFAMLLVGSLLALLVSWLMYTFPKLYLYLAHKRYDTLASMYKKELTMSKPLPHSPEVEQRR
jgi:hypothetical protein